jgi:hypothetical protein
MQVTDKQVNADDRLVNDVIYLKEKMFNSNIIWSELGFYLNVLRILTTHSKPDYDNVCSCHKIVF